MPNIRDFLPPPPWEGPPLPKRFRGPMILFHASPRWRKILQEGLKPRVLDGVSGLKGKYGIGRIYFWTDDIDAVEFAEQVTMESSEHPTDWGILEITRPADYKLRKDPEFWGQDVDIYYGTEPIPPENITLLRHHDTSKLLVETEGKGHPPRPYGGAYLQGYLEPKWILFQDLDKEFQEMLLKHLEISRRSIRRRFTGAFADELRELDDKWKEFREIYFKQYGVKWK